MIDSIQDKSNDYACWYYILRDEKNGPISLNEIHNLVESLVISTDTLVWRQGMPDWTKASEINCFKKYFIPPPIISRKQIKNNILHHGCPV
jgi:hypothetical protein